MNFFREFPLIAILRGSRPLVSPNTNPALIDATQRLVMINAPGAATPTGGFAAAWRALW